MAWPVAAWPLPAVAEPNKNEIAQENRCLIVTYSDQCWMVLENYKTTTSISPAPGSFQTASISAVTLAAADASLKTPPR